MRYPRPTSTARHFVKLDSIVSDEAIIIEEVVKHESKSVEVIDER